MKGETKRRLPLIALDGPSGSGKSTLGRELAKQLGFRYLDTGALYRAVALAAREAGIEWENDRDLSQLIPTLAISFTDQSEPRLVLNGVDRSQDIRREAIGMGASKVSRQPGVRQALLDVQRRMGGVGGTVVDGRDIGTVIFPDAEFKFFVDATLEERARRRYGELMAKGEKTDLDAITRDITVRDQQDRERSIAPLTAAVDAVHLDTTHSNIHELVVQLSAKVRAYVETDGGQERGEKDKT